MRIQSWNIQSTRGCDGRFDAVRIADVLKIDGIGDVICLQEVSRWFADYGGDDQLAFFSEAFPDHLAIWGPVMSRKPLGQGRREFGNLTLVRPELLEDYRLHLLPEPVVNGVYQMPRGCVEVRLRYKGDVLSILNTHLAYHSQGERVAQVRFLTELKRNGLGRYMANRAQSGTSAYEVLVDPKYYILCGDLNLTPDSGDYEVLTQEGMWQDSWTHLYAETTHAPTCGIFDQDQWGEGPHCRDFFFVTPELTNDLEKMYVNQQTDASDHQPIYLEIREE